MDNLIVRQAIKTAKELMYSKKTIEKIKNAKTEFEITRILASARKGEI